MVLLLVKGLKILPPSVPYPSGMLIQLQASNIWSSGISGLIKTFATLDSVTFQTCYYQQSLAQDLLRLVETGDW